MNILKLTLIFTLLGLFSFIILYCGNRVYNTVIFINGTSCAGKSSVAKAFKRILPNTEIIGLDEYIQEKFSSAQDDIYGSLGEKEQTQYRIEFLNNAYFQIKKLLNNKKNVIFDAPYNISTFNNAEEIAAISKILNEFPVFSILLYCPEVLLKQNIQKRNMLKNRREHRKWEEIEEDFKLLYEHVHDNNTPKCLINKRNNIIEYLTPRLSYDLVVDVSSYTPHQISKKIYEYIKFKKQTKRYQ